MDQDTQDQNSAPQSDAPMQAQQSVAQEAAPAQAAPQAEASSSNDNEKKLFSIIGYVVTPLFFLPLVQDGLKNDPYARFHAGQQLNLLILEIGVYVLMMILAPVLFFFLAILAPLAYIGILVFMVLGVMNALKGEMKELPIIGKFKVLK